jgi:hypothetical protein
VGCWYEPEPVGLANHIDDMEEFVLPGERARFDELVSEVTEEDMFAGYKAFGLRYHDAEVFEDDMMRSKIAYDRMVAEAKVELSAADRAVLTPETVSS